MEDPALPVRTAEQSKVGPGAEKVPVDPMPKSPVVRQPMEESTAATGELGGGEKLADGSVMVPEATAETTGSSGAEARATDSAPVSGTEGPTMPEE